MYYDMTFVDLTKGKAANLLEAGDVYADLHAALVERASSSNELAAKWKLDHPSKAKATKAKL